jgi:hypothetical protein
MCSVGRLLVQPLDFWFRRDLWCKALGKGEGEKTKPWAHIPQTLYQIPTGRDSELPLQEFSGENNTLSSPSPVIRLSGSNRTQALSGAGKAWVQGTPCLLLGQVLEGHPQLLL